jgi:hypothetical protein
MTKTKLFLCAASLLLLACGHSDDPDHGNESEVITTVVLTFTPEAGAPITAAFDDPDGDGGEAPTIDAIDLTPGNYTLAIAFENRLEDPPEDITLEIEDEDQEHQIFFTGSAVNGPASDNPGAALEHSYEDQDANALPVGLQNSVVASTGSGELIVTLRHLPPVAGASVKTAETSADVRELGFTGIGGSSDAQVTFPVDVQ